jgi:hypothetical protein
VVKRQNIIELNGKHYDATTGQQITPSTSDSVRPPQPATLHRKPTIDGITRRRRSLSHQAPEKPHVSPHLKTHVHTPAPNAHNMHHGKVKTARSKTLMRSIVTKPTAPHHTPSKAETPIINHAPTDQADTRLIQNPDRLHRAQHIPKSHQVSKFGDVIPTITKRVVSLDVQPAPTGNTHHAPLTSHHVSAPVNTSIDSLDSVDLFDLALEHSTAHEQPKIKKSSFRHRAARKLRVSPRALNIAAGVFVTLFVGGLVAYKTLPQLALKLASTRAGVNASLPSYQPSGFSMAGPIQYGEGAITLSYQSNSDDRNFQIVQKSSDWNSQALLENFVSSKEPYQTFQEKGRTIYIYGKSSATWVSGGVWYQIEGESDLSSDQLLRIVSSL